MDMNERDQAPEAQTPEAQAEPLLDEQGRRVFDDNGDKIHWATRYERIVALILALVVIAITIAMAYSIAVGDFFRW